MSMNPVDMVVAAWRAGEIDRDEMERRLQKLYQAREPVGAAPEPQRFQPTSALQVAANRQTNGRCWYCGEPGDSIDHQVPKSKSGPSTDGNCVLSCRTCNSRKATRGVEEFRAYLLIVHGRPPTRFYGEDPAPPKRDWIIVCDTPIEPLRRRDIFAERLATFMRGAPT